MGPHPKPRRHPYSAKLARKSLTKGLLRKEAKMRELAKLAAEMRPRPKPPTQKGTHYHETEPPLPAHYAPDAQWLKDGGWSGKR